MKETMRNFVSVILPVHNEEKAIRKNVGDLARAMDACGRDYEIIISEDGSTDETVAAARSMLSERIRLLHNPMRQGKGAAITKAAKEARGEIILFLDADLSSNPARVKGFVDRIADGADIVIGSRYHRDSKVKRTLLRYLASRSFNLLVNIILGSRLSDHQCGFKAFRRGPAIAVVSEVRDRGWFWDTEFLVRAQRRGLSISEMPLEWTESDTSKFNLLTDSMKMFLSMVRFGIRG